MAMPRESAPVTPARVVGFFVIIAVLASIGCGARDEASGSEGDADAAAVAVPAAAVPRASIVEPAEGAQVDGPNVRVILAIENLELAPAGDERPGTGHHHLFLNVPITDPGAGIPVGQPGIFHLGQAQTEFELPDLAPGEYTLISVVGDLVHRRIDPQALDTVRFTVRPR